MSLFDGLRGVYEPESCNVMLSSRPPYYEPFVGKQSCSAEYGKCGGAAVIWILADDSPCSDEPPSGGFLCEKHWHAIPDELMPHLRTLHEKHDLSNHHQAALMAVQFLFASIGR